MIKFCILCLIVAEVVLTSNSTKGIPSILGYAQMQRIIQESDYASLVFFTYDDCLLCETSFLEFEQSVTSLEHVIRAYTINCNG